MREYYPREKLIVAVKRGDIPAMFGWHEVCEVLNCSERNAHKILADLTKLGLLIKCGGRKRRNNHEYTLYELYDPIDNLIARVSVGFKNRCRHRSCREKIVSARALAIAMW